MGRRGRGKGGGKEREVKGELGGKREWKDLVDVSENVSHK